MRFRNNEMARNRSRIFGGTSSARQKRGATGRYRMLRKARLGRRNALANSEFKDAANRRTSWPASDLLTRTCESADGALAAAPGCAYRSSFNDDCAETLIRPQQTALVGD